MSSLVARTKLDTGIVNRPIALPVALLVVLLVALSIAGCEHVPTDSVTPSLQDDSPLALEVAAAIRQRPELARFRISVKSLSEDTVRLSGTVDSSIDKSFAEQAALGVSGVRSVVNTLFVD